MNEEHAHSTAAGCLLIFVGPTAVVGEGLALEELLVVRRRLIDNDQCDLALEVHTCVVVRVVLRRVDAVAHKDDGRVEVGCGLAGLVFGDNLGTVNQIDRSAACGDKRNAGLVILVVYGEKRDLLKIRSVVARRLQTVQGKLRGNVLRRQRVAARSGAASVKQVKRKEAHVGANLL